MYEYHLTFVSLILAVAITEILSSVGTYIRNYKNIEFSYFIAGWMLLSLLAITQFWYSIASHVKPNAPLPECGFFLYIMNVTSSIFHYLLSRLVFPDLSSYHFSETLKRCSKIIASDQCEKNTYSLDNYYYRNVISMCVVAIIIITLSIFHDIVNPLHTDGVTMCTKFLFRIVFFLIALITLVTSHYERSHPDETQERKNEFERTFTGVAYRTSKLMIAIFFLLFSLYIVTYHVFLTV